MGDSRRWRALRTRRGGSRYGAIEGAFSGGEHLSDGNQTQTSKIAGHADALITGPAGETVHLGRLCHECRIAPRFGANGQRWAVQANDRHDARCCDVKRSAVAPNEQGRVVEEGAQLQERAVAEPDDAFAVRGVKLTARLAHDLLFGLSG